MDKSQKSKLWYLSNINLFKGMSPKEMRWAEEKTIMKHNQPKSFDEIYAQAMGETKICAMPERDFEELLKMRPDLSIKLVKLIGLKLRTVEAKLSDLVFKDVKERLATLLLKLAEEYGQETREGLHIRLRLTHQDLANLIGSTRETTTLTLNELKKEGVVMLVGREIFIKNLSVLNQIASQV